MRFQRVSDWPARLAHVVEAERLRPFDWGTADCCLFVGDCILAMTGIDPASEFRGRYMTARGAQRCLRRYCGGGVEALAEKIAAEYRMPEILPKMAQRGDAVLLRTPECPPEGKSVGICVGVLMAAQGPQGLTMVPVERVLRAWRV
ncbi:DUF6950 family protein [Humidesulfovibrio idahonensis]